MSFPDLLDAALTGTLNRVPPRVTGGDEPISAERQLLRSASVLGLRRLAGRPQGPSEPVPGPSPAPPEVLRSVSRAATERLSDILERRPEALPEWLTLVNARGMRVRFASLPELLEYARYRGPVDRARIIEVGGQRMHWLASFTADWSFAAQADPVQQFNGGTVEHRAVALRRWRGRDAAAAREALRTTWREQRADQRAALLEALEVGVSIDDEEFLTHVLRSDARRDVREVALRLLRRIPASEFSRRWSARARTVFEVDGDRVVVHEPDGVDSVWAADGLDASAPKGIGVSAWVMRQVLALAPPDVWPAHILRCLAATDWPDVTRAGLADAVAAYASVEWCGALLAARVDSEYALQLVTGLPGPWSADFSRLLLQHLPALMDKHYSAGFAVLRIGAWRLDPGVLPLADAWLAAEADAERPWLRSALERLVGALEYRGAMRRELGQ